MVFLNYYRRNSFILGSTRAQRLRANYGLGIDEYAELLEKQDGGCAICGAEASRGKITTLHVDHDHETGEVRGVLCHGCNNGLGQFEDSIDRLRAAITYLENAGYCAACPF